MAAKKTRTSTGDTESRFWMWLCVAAFVVGAGILSHTLARLTDGDDALYFYDAGLKGWGTILRECFLPAESPAFVFSRWRPMGTLFFPKLMWTLGPSVQTYKILVWLFCGLNSLVFAWSAVRLFRLALPVAPGAVWAIAAIAWSSAPSLVLSSLVVPGILGMTAGHWAVGLLCQVGQGWRKALRLALSAGLALVMFQSYEANCFYFVWLGVWLFALRYFGKNTAKTAPWWFPLLLVALYVGFYRSVLPPKGLLGHVNSDGFIISLDPTLLATNFGYFLLAVLNGFARPLDALARMAGPGLDTTPADFPFAFLLTAGAIFLGYRLRSKAAQKNLGQTRAWLCAVGILVTMAFISSAPYWIVSNMRFIYFARITSGVFAVWFVLWIGRGKRLPRAPVLLLILGNTVAASQALLQWNWTEVNLQDSMGFVQEALAKPGFSDCTSEQPCCVRMSSRRWARNEWTLSWVRGAARYPAYYPEGFPGAPCVKHLVFD